MYTSVYFHKTVRIAENMLARTVERLTESPENMRFMNDSELMSWLLGQGGQQRQTALRLKYRKLYKRVLTRDRDELGRQEAERLAEMADPKVRMRTEDAVCKRAGIPVGAVLIDVPAPELLLTEPRIAKVDLKVWDDGRIVPFRKVSSLAKALQLRETVNWALMVASNPDHTEAAQRAARKVLLG